MAVCIPPIAKCAMDGAPGRYGVIGGRGKGNDKRQGKSERRGFFAALRMTSRSGGNGRCDRWWRKRLGVAFIGDSGGVYRGGEAGGDAVLAGCEEWDA